MPRAAGTRHPATATLGSDAVSSGTRRIGPFAVEEAGPEPEVRQGRSASPSSGSMWHSWRSKRRPFPWRRRLGTWVPVPGRIGQASAETRGGHNQLLRRGLF